LPQYSWENRGILNRGGKPQRLKAVVRGDQKENMATTRYMLDMKKRSYYKA